MARRRPSRHRSAFSFSGQEALHLVASTLVLSAAFAFPLSESFLLDSFLIQSDEPPGIRWATFLWPAFPVSLTIVLAAFVLHELAHKLVAQHYGMWAEFRASLGGLAVALGVSAAAGVVVAAPGAVVIFRGNKEPTDEELDRLTEDEIIELVKRHEREEKREAGVIAVAGPLVNITFALASFPLWLATDQSSIFSDFGLPSVGNFFQLAMLINVVLAGFNMVPVKPLDGSKIVRWNAAVFITVWLAVLGLGFLLFNGL